MPITTEENDVDVDGETTAYYRLARRPGLHGQRGLIFSAVAVALNRRRPSSRR